MPAKSLQTQKIELTEVSPEKTTDPTKVLSEFLGMDLSESDIQNLTQGTLELQVQENGSAKTVTISDPEAGQNLKHRMVAYLLARGYTRGEISKATGYSSSRISTLSKLPIIRELAGTFQDKIIDKLETDKKIAIGRLSTLSSEAVDTLEDGMKSSNEKIAHASAVKVLESIGLFDKKSKDTQIDIGIQIANLIADGYENKNK